MTHLRVAIIGSGPAAHTAAIYLARANLAPTLYEGFLAGGVAAGGQLTTTTEVENFPGFPHGLSGPALMDNMRQQSAKFGTVIVTETISKTCTGGVIIDTEIHPATSLQSPSSSGERASRPTQMSSLQTQSLLPRAPPQSGCSLRARMSSGKLASVPVLSAMVITAALYRTPASIRLLHFLLNVLTLGAVPIFRNKPLAVVGGGDSACEEAIFLTKFASKVYLLVRRDKLRASKVMADRAQAHPKIEIIWNKLPVKAFGDKLLRGLTLLDTVSQTESKLDVNGLFYAIGHVPNSAVFGGQLALHDNGYIKTMSHNGVASTYTSIKGVFACGDVMDYTYRQAVTAAGSGCMAALDCERWLEAHE